MSTADDIAQLTKVHGQLETASRQTLQVGKDINEAVQTLSIVNGANGSETIAQTIGHCRMLSGAIGKAGMSLAQSADMVKQRITTLSR